MKYRFACSLFAFALMSTSSGAALAQTRPAAPAKPAGSAPSPLSRATFIATMDAEYKKLDTNGDGVVTRAELEASRQRAAAADQAQQARALFVKYDTDRNGQLSLAEFIYATSGGPQAKPDVSPMMTKFDTNRDQKVTLIEYRTLTVANFDRMDADKDGIVTVAEMRAGGLMK